MVAALAFPAFIAGLITFLAPCTLPLLPAYLAFISGVPVSDLGDKEKIAKARKRIFLNGVLYVIGFSAVFVLLGSLVGLGGQALAQYTNVLTRIGGVLVMLFGIFMVFGNRVPWMSSLAIEKKIPIFRYIHPGTPLAALVFGATFALGWTPCVGPILGSILILAATSATVAQGAMLLAIFSLGLAIPFLIIAASTSWATTYVAKASPIFSGIGVFAGVLLIILGALMATNMFGVFVGFFYRIFGFVNLEAALLEYL